MYYSNINKRFTEIVSEYIGKGYTINTATMGGSQGEKAKVDFTDGTDIIRVYVASFNDWDNHVEGVEIVVGKCTNDVKPHDGTGYDTIWNYQLDVVNVERFYKIGENCRREVYYSDLEHAQRAADIRLERYIRRATTRQTVNLTAKHMDLAKRVIRRKFGTFGVKRITEADVMIFKGETCGYCVSYRDHTYRLR